MKSRVSGLRLIRPGILIFLFVWLSSMLISGALGTPELPRYSVTPRNGTPDDTFLFLVTYQDTENTPPEYVRLVAGEEEYELRAVNTADENYTDGKDYMVRTKLPEGTHIFYFEASNGSETTNTLATTIRIREENEFTHLDVAYSLLFATFIMLIPIIYGLYQIRRIAEKLNPNTKERSKSRKRKGEKLG